MVCIQFFFFFFTQLLNVFKRHKLKITVTIKTIISYILKIQIIAMDSILSRLLENSK